MRLLNKPLTRKERQNELDMINGNIARVSVSDDPVGIVAQLGFAIDRLNMVAYSRVIELTQQLQDMQK